MTLQDTIQEMLSEDWKERFKAEYHQLDTRTKKLQETYDLWEAGELPFKPKSTKDAFRRQLIYMRGYRDILKERSYIEGIDLSEPKTEE